MSLINDVNIAIKEGNFSAEFNAYGLNSPCDQIVVIASGIKLLLGEDYHWIMEKTDIDEWSVKWLMAHEILSPLSLRIIGARLQNDAEKEEEMRADV